MSCISADTLGNAYLTSFFVSGAWDRNKLHQSLKSYQNAVSESILQSIVQFKRKVLNVCALKYFDMHRLGTLHYSWLALTTQMRCDSVKVVIFSLYNKSVKPTYFVLIVGMKGKRRYGKCKSRSSLQQRHCKLPSSLESIVLEALFFR